MIMNNNLRSIQDKIRIHNPTSSIIFQHFKCKIEMNILLIMHTIVKIKNNINNKKLKNQNKKAVKMFSPQNNLRILKKIITLMQINNMMHMQMITIKVKKIKIMIFKKMIHPIFMKDISIQRRVILPIIQISEFLFNQVN